VTEEIDAASVPVLETVTDWAALDAPTVVDPKVSEVGLADRVAEPVVVPVPESATVVGLFVALLLTASEPVRVPLAAGGTSPWRCSSLPGREPSRRCWRR